MSIVIVGAGPNLGAAVARRFGREGMSVGLVARDAAKLEELANVLNEEGITADFAAADIRDAEALDGAIRSLAERIGPVEVLEYSPLPAKEFMKPIRETTVDDLRGPLEFSVLGAVAAALAVAEPMVEAGSGSILFTTGGAAVKPYPERAGVGVSFAGEVAYARMLHEASATKASTSATPRSPAASPRARTTSPTTSPRFSGNTTPTATRSRSSSASTDSPSAVPYAGIGVKRNSGRRQRLSSSATRTTEVVS